MTRDRLRRPRLASKPKAPWRVALGAQAWRTGHAAEWIAAGWLMLKGYRLLGFRLKAQGAEIDILATKGQVLVVVEVKQRKTVEAGLTAIGAEQLRRLRAAGATLLRQRPALRDFVLRIDAVTLSPGRFPRHRRGL